MKTNSIKTLKNGSKTVSKKLGFFFFFFNNTGSDSVVLHRRFCVSNKLPGDEHAGALRTSPWAARCSLCLVFFNKSSHCTVWRLGGSGDPPRTPPSPLSKDLHHAGGLLLLVLSPTFSVREAWRKLTRHNPALLSCLQCPPGSLGEAESCSHTSQGSCESVRGVQVGGHGS